MQIPTQEFLQSIKPHELEYLQSNKRFKWLRWHRGSHKTGLFLNDALIEAHRVKALYWYIGPYLKQARDTVWKDPNTNIFRWIPQDYLPALKKNESDLSITFPNGSVLQLQGADHPDSLRGPKPRKIWVDEYGEIAKRWGSEFREAILEPSIRSSGGGIDYGGTPKGSNDFAHLETLSLSDPANWFGSVKTVEDTGIYGQAEIAEMRKNAVNLDFFEQEYYCKIVEGASSVFRQVQAAISGELEPPQPLREYTFGIDLARTFDRTAIVGFRNSTNHLVYFRLLENKQWDTQRFEIKQVLRKYNDALAVVDATGVGDSFVSQLLSDQLKVIPLKIANNLIKRNLVEKLATYIENRYITFPNIPQLISELQDFEYKLSSQNNVLYSAPSGKHDDIVMALALAVSRLNPVPTIDTIPSQSLAVDARTGYLA